ncbi:MAG: ABC transporter permease [Chloroflexi bacterium]|nr:ABC transporter permease [Chloroflexota bacterium]
MSWVNVLVILRKELGDALRNRWLLLFAVAFGGLAVALGELAPAETAGRLSFSRTMAGLINLTAILVPLIGLSLGAQSVAGESERRTLAYLLTQPIGRTELLLGKYLGLALALVAALAVGFGSSGVLLASGGFDPGLFLQLVGLAVLLALTSLSLGLLVSVLNRRTAVALGIALFLWFALILLADLGLMGSAIAFKLQANAIFLLALLNPLQVFKLAAVLTVSPTLDVLGPAGLYGTAQFGRWLGPLLVGMLLAWSVVALLGAGCIFARRGEP